jgi:hypothetical protein
MANDVEFTVPRRELGRSDVEFLVKRDGSVLGALKVSNSSLVWFPKKTSYGDRMGWNNFDKFMKKHASGEECRIFLLDFGNTLNNNSCRSQ